MAHPKRNVADGGGSGEGGRPGEDLAGMEGEMLGAVCVCEVVRALLATQGSGAWDLDLKDVGVAEDEEEEQGSEEEEADGKRAPAGDGLGLDIPEEEAQGEPKLIASLSSRFLGGFNFRRSTS